MWIHYLSGPCGDSSSHFPPIKCNFEMFLYIHTYTHIKQQIKYIGIDNIGIDISLFQDIDTIFEISISKIWCQHFFTVNQITKVNEMHL